MRQQDFMEFVRFLEGFSLANVVNDEQKLAAIRHTHSQLLALLTVAGELLSAPEEVVYQKFVAAYGSDGRSYLGEVVSDASEFVMCILLGLYRAAGGTLRSAIESYLKAFSAAERPSILQRTSVPEVFNDAASVSFFSSVVGANVIGGLRGAYGELNSYVHTVSQQHMFAANAVGSFPRWSEKTERLVELFGRINRLFLYGVVGGRRDLYDQFDHRNKVIANRAMTRLQRRSAMGVDD